MANTAFKAGSVWNNQALGQKPIDPKPKYASPPDKEDEESKKLKDVRAKFAPNADKPTTASGKPGLTDLPSLLKMVDPSNLSSFLPSMFSQLNSVNQVMQTSIPAARKEIIQDSLTGALCILVKTYGFDRVILAMLHALDDGGIDRITESHRSIVENAFANLVMKAGQYGPNNIPVSSEPVLVYTIITPYPIVKESEVPDLYIQQYYTADADPYPGYIQWAAPSGTFSSYNTSYVYTMRTKEQPPYESANEEIYAISEKQLAEALNPYIRDDNLTAEKLNEFLDTQHTNIENNSMERNLGKNSSTNLMSLLSMLLGILGQIIDKTKSDQLPNSVLNQGSVNKTLESFSKSMGMLKQMKQSSATAFNPLSSLQSMGNISSIVGSLTSVGGIPTSTTQAVSSIMRIMGKS